MHYSIQQDFARQRHAELLQQAERSRLAASAREGDDRPRFARLSGLLGRLQRQRVRRPAPAT